MLGGILGSWASTNVADKLCNSVVVVSMSQWSHLWYDDPDHEWVYAK